MSAPAAEIRIRRTMNTPVVNQPVTVASLHDATSHEFGARMTTLARQMARTPGIDEFATTGWLPDAFFDAMKELYAIYDQYIAHNIAASELKIVCQLGCTRCCRQAVHGCYSFEIIDIYRQLRPRADYGELHNALVDSADEFQSMLARYSEKAQGRADVALLNTLQHFSALAKPCPLLGGNNCRVYEHRPVSCRMYYSLTSPIYCTTVVGRTFHLLPPDDVAVILADLNDRLAFPYSEFLSQGLVVFAASRQFRPWGPPPRNA
jgi:Fe-S-cluster containining protein